MNSVELEIEGSGLFQEEREQFTQTSSLSVAEKDPSIFGDVDVEESVENSVTIFEYCQIIQDPDHPTTVIKIVKEKVTEETKNHPANLSGETETANRYKYCREVIKPYLKPRADCTKVSSEIILKEAIESASEDFPDCYPDLINQKNIKTIKKAAPVNNLGKVDAVTSYTDMDAKKSKECVPKCEPDDPNCEESCPDEGQSTPPRSSSPKQKPPCGPPVHTPPKCEKEKNCRPKVKKVCKESKCEKLPELIIVKEFSETKTFEEDDNPENFSLENEEDDQFENLQIETHNDTVSTIKVAMEDFIDKVYETTQNTMTIITSESIKALETVKASEAANTIIQMRDNVNEISQTIGLYLSENLNPQNEADDNTTANVIGNIMTKVDSALSMLGNKITESFENFNNTDDVNSTSDQPRASNNISHVFTPNTMSGTNSMFSAIKSKIISMFSDSEPKEKEKPLLSTKTSVGSSASLESNK